MLERLKALPSVRKLAAQYEQLGERDRKALQFLALALVIVGAYLLVWRPIAEFRAEARAEMERSRELLEWVRGKESEARTVASANGQSGGGGELGGRDLMQTVTDSAERSGLPLQRFEDGGEDSLRIWLEDVRFTDLTQWLAHLETRYAIAVAEASIDREEGPGLVDARLILEI